MTDSNTLLKKQSHLQIKTGGPSKALISLDDLGVLKVTGDDALGFLQNLVTNDVNNLAINQAQLAGLCNPKGRLFAIFTIVRLQDSFLLVLTKTTLPVLQKRLSMYVLRSKVTITDETTNLSCLGLITTSTDNLLNNITFPSSNYQAEKLDTGIILKAPSNISERFMIIADNDLVSELTNTAINEGWESTPESLWQLEDIMVGQPCIYPETQEKFTPQQLNLDLIDGVSFKKGCYPGQEIVARLHYLGSPSRRMFIAKSNAINENLSGEDILSEEQTVAGQIVRAETIGEITHSLVSIKLSEVEKSLSYNGIDFTLQN